MYFKLAKHIFGGTEVGLMGSSVYFKRCLQTLLMFFVIGTCWFWLILYIIPGIPMSTTPDYKDYMFSIFMCMQSLSVFIIAFWNHSKFIKAEYEVLRQRTDNYVPR